MAARSVWTLVLVAAMTAATLAREQAVQGVDTRARTALDEMRAAYAALAALHVKIKWTARYSGDMSADDFPLPGPDELELRMQRPNKLFLSALAVRDGKSLRYQIVSDGTTVSYWQSAPNTYTQRPAPPTLAELPRVLPDTAIGTFDGSTWESDSILEWDLLTGVGGQLGDLGISDLIVTLGPRERLRGTDVDVVRLTYPDGAPVAMEVSVLLSTTNRLVRGYRLTGRGPHPDTGRPFTVAMQSDYEICDAQPKFGSADFVFTPPPGAKKKTP